MKIKFFRICLLVCFGILANISLGSAASRCTRDCYRAYRQTVTQCRALKNAAKRHECISNAKQAYGTCLQQCSGPCPPNCPQKPIKH